MDSDITTQLLTMQAARTNESVQVALVRKSQEMDDALLNMIDETTKAAPPLPPPGQGLVVDKRA